MSKIILPKSLILSLVGALLVTPSVWAGATAVEGIVKNPSGRPVKGADVRIEAKKFSKIVKTDARGHYIFDGLGAGTYKVTLLVNGQVEGSLDAKTQAGKATQLNLSLAAGTASAKKKTHWVYVRPDVDTHIGGGGSWVEVDENGVPVAGNTGAGSNVQTITGTAAQQTILRQPVQNPGR
jgi:hypothetical protein